MNKPELMSGVSGWTALRAAIDAGADAVYFGVKELNMRITAKNFGLKDLKKVVELCHENKVKAYLTVNVIIYEKEIKLVDKILKKAKEAGIDAIIAWDMSVLSKAKELKHTIFLSTQASVSNSEAAKAYKKLGVKRIVLARECSLKDIKKMKKETDIEIETFVHGAMCVSVSGRCFTSQFMFNRSANRGDCLQPCRRAYKVTDLETGDELDVKNNYVMSAKDMCTLPFLKDLVKAKIDSLKIEGRNRSPEYVKTTTSCYREAIDAIHDKTFNKELIEKLTEKLKTVYHRDFSSGFFLGRPGNEDFCTSYGSQAVEKKQFIGKIVNYFKKPKAAEIKLNAGTLKKGDKIFIMGETTGIIELTIEQMQWHHKDINVAKKGQNIALKIGKLVRKNDEVYKVVKRKA